MRQDPITLPDLAGAGAERYARHPAIERVSGTERTTLSHAELWERARRGASVLRATGIAPGDRILLILPGGPEWAASFFAILEAGGVAVPVAPETPAATIAAIAAHAGAQTWIMPDRSHPIASAARGATLLVPEDLARESHAGAPERTGRNSSGAAADIGGDRGHGAARIDPDATAVLCFTSGSTANPRAVALSHRNLLSNVRALLSVGQAHPGDAFLSILPLSHLFELVCGFLAPLSCGARIVYAGVPLPNRVVASLRDERITHAFAVPALLEAFCREVLSEFAAAGSAGDARTPRSMKDVTATLLASRSPDEIARIRERIRSRIGPSFRTLVVGGAALEPGWAELIEPLGIELQLGYGLTEAGPIVSGGLASACPTGSVGRPLPGVEVRIGPDDEILVRGPSVMKGYFKDPEGTAAALAGGWLHTGDSGRLDDDGVLYLTGRIKEVLVTAAGETLYPEEVEPYYASPLFAEQCVVPLPGPGGNEVPTLVVVPATPGTSDDDLQRAVAGLRAAAPPRCRVAGFVRHDGALPRTALGKIRRRATALVALALRGKHEEAR